MLRSEDYLSVNAWTDVNSYPFPYPVSFYFNSGSAHSLIWDAIRAGNLQRMSSTLNQTLIVGLILSIYLLWVSIIQTYRPYTNVWIIC